MISVTASKSARVEYRRDGQHFGTQALLGRADAARLCGLDITEFSRLIVAGEGPPAVRIGTVHRFRVGSLRAWSERRIAEGCPDETPRARP